MLNIFELNYRLTCVFRIMMLCLSCDKRLKQSVL
nr:MAG TPA: hypothetical protein [Caudoviricetes sp.]